MKEILWKKLQSEWFSIFTCLSFCSTWFLSVCPFSSVSTANLCSKNTCQFLIFRFLKFCAAALFFLQKLLLIVILLLIVLFSVSDWFDWILNQIKIWLFLSLIILLHYYCNCDIFMNVSRMFTVFNQFCSFYFILSDL